MLSSTIHFGPFRLTPAARLLECEGASVAMGSRALDLLIALTESPGKTLSTRELMQRVWPDQTVEIGNLRVHLTALRKALGASADGQ